MKRKKEPDCIRLQPQEQICPAYEPTGAKVVANSTSKKMGFYVTDNFPEEHIQ